MNRREMTARGATVALVVGMVTGGAYASEKLFDLSHQTNQQAVQIDQLSSSLDASRQQLQVNGITPTVPSANEVLKGTAAASSPTAGASAKVDPGSGRPSPAQSTLSLLFAATDPRRKP